MSRAGGISGTVKEDGSAHPLAGVSVKVTTPGGKYITQTSTKTDGSYLAGGLTAGSYQVCFTLMSVSGGTSPTGLLGQCYNDIAPPGIPTSIAVTAGSTVAAINASIHAAGAVSGTVTDATTHAFLSGVQVTIQSTNGQPYYATARTGSDGSYLAVGLPTGSYSVCFDASNLTAPSSTGYRTQCWKNVAQSGAITPVSITAGSTTPAIGAQIVQAAAVTGKVTTASHLPLQGVQVRVRSGDGSDSAQTTADGSWTVDGLGAGAVSVCFDPGEATGGDSTTGYLPQCWNDVSTTDTPTPVTVTLGQTTTGIDATLAAAGAIAGKVTDSGTGALAHVVVRISSSASWDDQTTAADGTYSVIGLMPGDYTVCFSAGAATGGASTTGYLDQCWDHVGSGDTPTPIPVTGAHVSTGISAKLTAAAAVSGKVTDAAGTGLTGVSVSIRGPDYGYATTAADGTYTALGLSAGTTYSVCFDPTYASGGASTTGYLPQCFNRIAAGGTPTPVTLSLAHLTGSVNGTLAAAGALSGIVTDSGGHPLRGVYWTIRGQDRWETGSTGNDGKYQKLALNAGNYTVCFDPRNATGGTSSTGYAAQCYLNIDPAGTPTPVAVTLGHLSAGINQKLPAAGGISGTVTDTGGHPLGNVSWTISGTNSWNSGSTGSDGKYSKLSLTAGNYTVCFDPQSATGGTAISGYTAQCYLNIDPDGTPTPVAVTLAHISAGINQKLAEPGGVSGKVTDAVSGVALGAVDVYLYDKSWNTVAVASTGSDGSYAMTHVRAGTFFVGFFAWRATGGSANGYPDQYYDGVPIEGTPTSVTVAAGVIRTGTNAKLIPYD